MGVCVNGGKGAASAATGSNLFTAVAAAAAPTAATPAVPVYTGESAEFIPNGTLQRIRLGSTQRNQGWQGDPLPLSLPKGTHLEARVLKLTGTTNRDKTSLPADVLATLGSDWKQLGNQSTSNGVWLVANASQNLAVWPVQRIDVSSQASSIWGNGEFIVKAGSYAVTFAPSFADPQGFAAELLGYGLTPSILSDGVWHVTWGETVFVAQPDWEYFDHSYPGFGEKWGRLAWTDKAGRQQWIDPAFADLEQLIAIFKKEDPTLQFQWSWRGKTRVVFSGVVLDLTPDMAMQPTPASHKGQTWWLENGKVYVRYPDYANGATGDYAQGFTVELAQ